MDLCDFQWSVRLTIEFVQRGQRRSQFYVHDVVVVELLEGLIELILVDGSVGDHRPDEAKDVHELLPRLVDGVVDAAGIFRDHRHLLRDSLVDGVGLRRVLAHVAQQSPVTFIIRDVEELNAQSAINVADVQVVAVSDIVELVLVGDDSGVMAMEDGAFG